MSTPVKLPCVEPADPTCPFCYGTAPHNGDGFVCEDCKVWWEDFNSPGQFVDDETEPCGAEPSPERRAAYPQYTYSPCALPADHAPGENNHWFQWKYVRA